MKVQKGKVDNEVEEFEIANCIYILRRRDNANEVHGNIENWDLDFAKDKHWLMLNTRIDRVILVYNIQLGLMWMNASLSYIVHVNVDFPYSIKT